MEIILNAKILPVDPSSKMSEAVAIDHGKIIAVGSEAEIKKFEKPGTKITNLGGRKILPGLIDAHIHLEYYAKSLQEIFCETNTRQDLLDNVAERIKQIEAGEWITGFGWNHNIWPEGLGDAALLDAISPRNPVALASKSGHSMWANTIALRLAGITAETTDPAGGRIERDTHGKPTGILQDNAIELVYHVIPAPGDERLSRWLLDAQKTLFQMGVTGVNDFDHGTCFAALQLLDKKDMLRLRVAKSIPLVDVEKTVTIGLRSGFGSSFLKTGHVKLFSDGALGAQTALMLEPYSDSRDTGIQVMDEEQIFEVGKKAAVGGFPLAVHAIGDKANRLTINALEKIRKWEKQNSLPALRHRIEHVQLLHPDDYHRLAFLGITASMQPLHATSDIYIAEKYWGKRSEGGYAWRTLLSLGTSLAFGSDAPVETPNPFSGIHAAVTRRRQNGDPGEEGWYPKQRLSLAEALTAYTTGAAATTGDEHRLGRIKANFEADLIVLDDDPYQLPSQELFRIKPSATMVAGEWVWRDF